MGINEKFITIDLTKEEAEKLMIILEDSDFYDDEFKIKLMRIIDKVFYPENYE